MYMILPNHFLYYQYTSALFQKAEEALKFYKGYKGKDEGEDDAISREIERLKLIASERKTQEKINATDFCRL